MYALSSGRRTRGKKAWRYTSRGVEVATPGDNVVVPTWDWTLPRTDGEPLSVRGLWEDFPAFVFAAQHFGVKLDTLVALAACEANRLHGSLHFDPKSIRLEPGYRDDYSTPNKVSPGLMQTLLSTARGVAKSAWGLPAEISRATLFDPRVSIVCAAAYLQTQWAATKGDPVLLQAAYNAGGVYASNKNDWNLRTYGEGRTEKFIAYFNDFWAFADSAGGGIPEYLLTHAAP